MSLRRKAIGVAVRIVAKVARATSSTFGHDSGFVRKLDSVYNIFIAWSDGGAGLRRTINEVPCLIDQRYYRGLDHYEEPVAAFLKERVRPGQLCIDVGAHIGLYVLQFAHWSRPNGRMIAFEPNPAAREGLERHVKLNHLAERVEIVPCAVGANAGKETFYAAGTAVESRLRTPNSNIADRMSAFPVKVVTLDDWCQTRSLTPDWLLIDIEGLEIAALEGARKLVSSRRNRLGIVVEMHPQFWALVGTGRAQAESLLNELKMRPIPLTGQTDPLAEYGLVHLAYI